MQDTHKHTHIQENERKERETDWKLERVRKSETDRQTDRQTSKAENERE